MTVYAEVGSSLQQIGGDCPDGWVVMQGERPSPDHVAQRSGEWWVNHEDMLRKRFKAERAAAVKAITVTTAAGNTFDGDEESQGRMTRAILALQASGEGATVNWVLADNSVIQTGSAELTEALALAGAEQARLWLPNASPAETPKGAAL